MTFFEVCEIWFVLIHVSQESDILKHTSKSIQQKALFQPVYLSFLSYSKNKNSSNLQGVWIIKSLTVRPRSAFGNFVAKTNLVKRRHSENNYTICLCGEEQTMQHLIACLHLPVLLIEETINIIMKCIIIFPYLTIHWSVSMYKGHCYTFFVYFNNIVVHFIHNLHRANMAWIMK